MKTNNQPSKPNIQSAHRSGVKPSTFLGTVALSVALLGLVGGRLGHKQPVLIQGDAQATNIKVAPQAADANQAWHVYQGDEIRKELPLVSLESLHTRMERDCALTGLRKELEKIPRGSYADNICLQSNLWIKAKSAAEHAQENVNRSRELEAGGVISRQELQASEKDLDLARSSEQAARASFDLAVGLYSEVEQIAVAAEQSAQRIAELEALVAGLKVNSPIYGEAEDQSN